MDKEFKYFEFQGNAKEYFRIWIVNIALTVLTFGIYSAWAKVRTHRYMYANTYLNGSNFEYNADPIRILVGRIIVFVFYLLFILFGQQLMMFEAAAGIALFAFILSPWLIRQAVSFKLRNTSYRHVPFRYVGKTVDFYAFFLTHSLLNIFTLFLAFPFSYVRFKELVLRNSRYGQGEFSFNGKVQSVYEIYFSIIGWMTLILITVAIIVSLISGLVMEGTGVENFLSSIGLNIESGGDVSPVTNGMVTIFMVLIYLPLIFGQKGMSDAYFSNYVRNHTTLENAPFRGEMNTFKLAWISISNVFVTILSLGLLYPWTQIRYLKYKLEQTSLACQDYDQFESYGYEQGTTVGEEMVDFFDIDIGL